MNPPSFAGPRIGALALLATLCAAVLPTLSRASPPAAFHGQGATTLVAEDFPSGTVDEHGRVLFVHAVEELPVPEMNANAFECVRSQVHSQGLGSALFEPRPEGDGTIGTLPVTLAGGSTMFLRLIGGEPGTTITFSRGGLSIVGATDWPTTEDLAAPENTVTVSWISGGMTVKVTMAPQPGETDDGFTIRLARRVNALKKSFPQDVANQP